MGSQRVDLGDLSDVMRARYGFRLEDFRIGEHEILPMARLYERRVRYCVAAVQHTIRMCVLRPRQWDRYTDRLEAAVRLVVAVMIRNDHPLAEALYVSLTHWIVSTPCSGGWRWVFWDEDGHLTPYPLRHLLAAAPGTYSTQYDAYVALAAAISKFSPGRQAAVIKGPPLELPEDEPEPAEEEAGL